uniref:PiggyBac transposable element-derived protein 2-like n=1 Tax=Diabrotica virgifera virgifera TaxID=50390 RepID=A0A6P7GI74_DIAVI
MDFVNKKGLAAVLQRGLTVQEAIDIAFGEYERIDDSIEEVIYFDNLFTTFSLLSYLRLKGYRGTGTIRENRLPRSCPFLAKNDVLKQETGYYESAISKTDAVLVAKEVNNSVVCIASNRHSINTITNV